jgi:hypothetical protein
LSFRILSLQLQNLKPILRFIQLMCKCPYIHLQSISVICKCRFQLLLLLGTCWTANHCCGWTHRSDKWQTRRR